MRHAFWIIRSWDICGGQTQPGRCYTVSGKWWIVAVKHWSYPLVPGAIWLAFSVSLTRYIKGTEGKEHQAQISISTWSRQLVCVYFRKLPVIDQRELGASSMAPWLVSLLLSFMLILHPPFLFLSGLVKFTANDLRRTVTWDSGQVTVLTVIYPSAIVVHIWPSRQCSTVK